MDKYIGTLLGGRYEILEVLGVGGMAMVYKARCRVLNRFVAIKILKEEFAQDEESAAVFTTNRRRSPNCRITILCQCTMLRIRTASTTLSWS